MHGKAFVFQVSFLFHATDEYQHPRKNIQKNHTVGRINETNTTH